MIENVKNQTRKLRPREQSNGIELLTSFALPGEVRSGISAAQILQFRREVEADPEISPAVKGALLELSDRELGELLL